MMETPESKAVRARLRPQIREIVEAHDRTGDSDSIRRTVNKVVNLIAPRDKVACEPSTNVWVTFVRAAEADIIHHHLGDVPDRVEQRRRLLHIASSVYRTFKSRRQSAPKYDTEISQYVAALDLSSI